MATAETCSLEDGKHRLGWSWRTLQLSCHWAWWWRWWAPQMDNCSGLAAWLGLTLLRIVQKLLDHWKTKVLCHDCLMYEHGGRGEPFPAIFLAPDFKDCASPLVKDFTHVSLEDTSGKTLYKVLVKTMNRQGLKWESRHAVEEILGPSSRLQAPVEGTVQSSTSTSLQTAGLGTV